MTQYKRKSYVPTSARGPSALSDPIYTLEPRRKAPRSGMHSTSTRSRFVPAPAPIPTPAPSGVSAFGVGTSQSTTLSGMHDVRSTSDGVGGGVRFHVNANGNGRVGAPAPTSQRAITASSATMRAAALSSALAVAGLPVGGVRSYFDLLGDEPLRLIIKHVVGSLRKAPAPQTRHRHPYPEGQSRRVARLAAVLLRLGGRMASAAEREFHVITEREHNPANDGDGLILCTKEAGDYAALADLLSLLNPQRIIYECDAVPKRWTKLISRHSSGIMSLGCYFKFPARGHELDRILAATVPLELLEVDFEHTDGSFVRALQKHTPQIKKLKMSFTGSKKLKHACSLRDVWFAAGPNLREVSLITTWGDRFEAVDTLLRACPNARVSINGRLIRG